MEDRGLCNSDVQEGAWEDTAPCHLCLSLAVDAMETSGLDNDRTRTCTDIWETSAGALPTRLNGKEIGGLAANCCCVCVLLLCMVTINKSTTTVTDGWL